MKKIKNIFNLGKNFLVRVFSFSKKGIGKTLVILGETEKDDEIITAISKTVLLAAQKEYLGSTPLNEEMIEKIYKKAFEVINEKEVKLGKKLSI